MKNKTVCQNCDRGINKKNVLGYGDQFCSCRDAQRLLGKISRREISCPICKNNGLIGGHFCQCSWGQEKLEEEERISRKYYCKQKCGGLGICTFPGTTTEFCSCETAKELLKKIENGEVNCPICKNTGIHNGFYRNNFCVCAHGQRLRKEVQANPSKCPFCKGKGKYPYGVGMNSYNVECYH